MSRSETTVSHNKRNNYKNVNPIIHVFGHVWEKLFVETRKEMF